MIEGFEVDIREGGEESLRGYRGDQQGVGGEKRDVSSTTERHYGRFELLI